MEELSVQEPAGAEVRSIDNMRMEHTAILQV